MADAPTYLAFDLGASSGRAVLGRLVGDRMEMEVIHRFETPLLDENGRLRWNAEELWASLREGLRRALEAAPDLCSLSVDSWAVDYVPLDAGGAPLRRPYAYRDPVRNAMMAVALERVPPGVIYAATGIQFMSFNTLYQVLSDREREPELFERTHCRLTIADYFNHRFGGRPVMDVSMASTTQVMDARHRAWSPDVLGAFDLPTAGWPELVPCGTQTGFVTEAPSVAVVAGCSHDTACAVAAAPAAGGDDAWAYISCGTWSLMGVELAEPVLTDAAREAGFTNEAGLSGTIRFLRNLTGLWALQECVREWAEQGRAVDYDTLLAEAAAVPSSGVFVDLDDPQFMPRGGMEARLLTYCRESGLPVPEGRGALTRLILESIAESYRKTLRSLEAVLGHPLRTIHLVGGGSQNALLCRLTAEACGCTVVAGPVEATALGNLLVQAQTMGHLPVSVRAAARTSSELKTYEPGEKG